MISEKTFIRYYSTFWAELLPGIDYYVRMINSGLKKRLYYPIEIEDTPSRRVLTSRISYQLFYRKSNANLNYREIQEYHCDLEEITRLQSEEAKKMSSWNNSEFFKDDISTNELLIIEETVKRLLLHSNYKENLVIYPKFQGCGLLFDCSGDMFYERTLVEVKGGMGNFKRQDLLQMLTYGALNYIAEKPKSIDNFELLNIRTGFFWREKVENLCEIIAGASSSEIYSEITSYISNNYNSI